MSTQLTLDAWRRELCAVSDDMLPLDQALCADSVIATKCRLTTLTDLSFHDLHEEVREVLLDFFHRNPSIGILNVAVPSHQLFPTTKTRGLWELLAYRHAGLSDEKYVNLSETDSLRHHSTPVRLPRAQHDRETIRQALERVLMFALRDWNIQVD